MAHLVISKKGDLKTYNVPLGRPTPLRVLLQQRGVSHTVNRLCLGCSPEVDDFIEELDGVKNTTFEATLTSFRGEYWLIFVNGKLAETSISKIVVNPNDVVELRYCPVSFSRSTPGAIGHL